MTDFTTLTNAELMTRSADLTIIMCAMLEVFGVTLDGDVGAEFDAFVAELRSRAGLYE